MEPINLFIRYSDFNVTLEQIGTLSKEGLLIYNDEGDSLKAPINTSIKFALLTVGSPLISLTRLVRSAVFLFTGQFENAEREFIGSLATPLVAAGCCIGSLFSSIISVFSSENNSFYISARRTYSNFEAWINRIDLRKSLPSYSHRASGLGDFTNRIWTTAPCMQPLLENGFSTQGGLLDPSRMQKILPFVQVKDVLMENGKVVIQSEYQDENVVYTACDGAFEHRKISFNCCCCYRIEAVYERILCCQIGNGTCTSILDSGDSCGVVSACCCGVGACCCYVTENNKLTELNSGCFGPQGICYVTPIIKTEMTA